MNTSNTIKNKTQILIVTYVVTALLFSNIKNITGLYHLTSKGIKKLKDSNKSKETESSKEEVDESDFREV